MIIRRLMLAVLSLGLLAGCAAGNNSVTLKPYTPTDGNQAQSELIKVRNFLVIAAADGSATIIGTAVNAADESDAITSISVNNVPVLLTPASLPLEKNVPVIFGGESATATATIPALGAKPGQLVPALITFTKAAPVEMMVLVREATGEFAGLAPSATPTPTETATP